MAKMASKEFAIKMVRACLPLTPTHLTLNGLWMDMVMEDNMRSISTGVLSIAIQGFDSTVIVSYSLRGPGDGVTWTEGRCEISLSSNSDEKWEFYCETGANGLIVTPMATYRLRSVLKNTIQATLINLGNNAGAVSTRLRRFGFSPDAEGVKDLLEALFGVFTIITMVSTPRGDYNEFYVSSTNNPDIWATGKIPKAVNEMFERTST